ncbi:MAG: hypothetical protein ACE5I4_04940 [Thermoplasmata archaeon]
MEDRDHKGSLRSTWWLGPLGVLLGIVIVFLYLFLSAFPGDVLFAVLVVPAASGYAFRALMRRTSRATFSSVGTAAGWMLFFGLLVYDPGGLGFVLFVGSQLLFGPGGIVVLGLVALGFILVSQGLASRAVRRVLPS